MKKLTKDQLIPAQLGDLAEQLPGASPLRARELKDKIVSGFYGRDEMRLVDAFRFSDVEKKVIKAEGAVLRPFDVAAVIKSGQSYILVAKANGQRDRYYRVESVRGRWGFWGGVLILNEADKRQIQFDEAELIGGMKEALRLRKAEKILHDTFGDTIGFPTQNGNQTRPLANLSSRRNELKKFPMIANPKYANSTLPELVAMVFPDTDFARVWMRVPCPGLGGQIPAKMSKTRKGRQEVKDFLVGVGSGNFM